MSIPTVLERIVEVKHAEVAARKALCSQETLQRMLPDHPCRGFVQSLLDRAEQSGSGIIAEIKRASPSKGVIREHFEPSVIAEQYEQAGAACLSVLTDIDFFKGSDEYLKQAATASTLPILRKDFVVDEYQIYEARVLGADCILLIAAILTDQQLSHFFQLATSIGLDVLVEVHDEGELKRALNVSPSLIGINNRNLHNFETSLETTTRLLQSIPDNCFVVTESGIHTREDVSLMHQHHVKGFLVGEAFMRADNPGDELKRLFYAD